MTSQANASNFNVVPDEPQPFPHQEHFMLNGTNEYVTVHANLVDDVDANTFAKSVAKGKEAQVDSNLQELLLTVEHLNKKMKEHDDKYRTIEIRLNIFSTLLHDMLENMKTQNEATAKMQETLTELITSTQRATLMPVNNNDHQTNQQTVRTDILQPCRDLNGKQGGQSVDDNHKRKAVDGNNYENIDDTVVLALSSDEDVSNNHAAKDNVVGQEGPDNNAKPQIPLEWLGGKASTTKKQVGAPSGSKSEYTKRSKTKEGVPARNGSAPLSQIVKKLFNTPSPANTFKQMHNPQLYDAMAHISVAKPESSSKSRVSNLAKGCKLNFKITKSMGLTDFQERIMTFLYHPKCDSAECLIRSRKIRGHRYDLDSLIPGRIVSGDILTIAAEKIWHNQKNVKSVWVLPSSFAEDLFWGRTLYELTATYVQYWMPPYEKLKYIYIPIKDGKQHWYLMVISIQHQTIYHFDTFCREEDIEPRREQIKILAECLGTLARAPSYGSTFAAYDLYFEKWEIKEARGIPNVGHSDNSGVWVLQWMDMEHFFTPNPPGTLEENLVRVRMALGLSLGDHNELKACLVGEAHEFWDSLPDPPPQS